MKHIYFILIFSSFSILSLAQENSKDEVEIPKGKEILLKKKNTISISPINAGFRDIQLSYERRFKDRNSFILLSTFSFDNLKEKYTSYKAFSNELHYRRYIFVTSAKGNKAFNNSVGIYASAFGGHQFIQESYRDEYFDPSSKTTISLNSDRFQNAFLYGLLAGFNINIIKGMLSLNFYGGFAHKVSFQKLKGFPNFYGLGTKFRSTPGFLANDKNGIIPKLNLQIGFNF